MENETSIGQPIPTAVPHAHRDHSADRYRGPDVPANQPAGDQRAGFSRAGDKPFCGNDVRPDRVLGMGLRLVFPALRSPGPYRPAAPSLISSGGSS